MPTTEQRTGYTFGTDRGPRRTGLVTMVVLGVLLAVALIGAAVLVIGAGGESPEDVVTESVEAFNAEDLWGLQAIFDPDIVVTYDGTAVGLGAGMIPDEVGRDTVLRNIETAWTQGDITVSQEILETDGDTVVASETAILPDGSSTRHTVTYTVSDDDLITRIEHVIEE